MISLCKRERGVGSSRGGAGGRQRVLGNNTSRGVLALALVCAVAGALLTAAPASAASRGFKVHNESKHSLLLVGARAVPSYVCVDVRCVPSYYAIGFEGRPADGAVLHPGKTDVWELKWSFSLFGGVQYAANVVYKIVGTDATVEYRIETYTTSNDSYCKIIGTSSFTCTAGGTALTFKNR